MPDAKIICSLCQHEIPAAFLRKHQEAERREIEAYTVELIKQSHPEWTEMDPTCQRCWDEYKAEATA